MDASAAYLRLCEMVRSPNPPRPRTVEEEDRIALEDLVLHTMGPDALQRYQWRWQCLGHPEDDRRDRP